MFRGCAPLFHSANIVTRGSAPSEQVGFMMIFNALPHGAEGFIFDVPRAEPLSSFLELRP